MGTAESDTNDLKKEIKLKMPTIEKLLNFIQDRDARLGLVLSVFLLFLLVFTWFSSAYGGIFEEGFWGLIRAFGLFLLLATGFVIFFKAISAITQLAANGRDGVAGPLPNGIGTGTEMPLSMSANPSCSYRQRRSGPKLSFGTNRLLQSN